MNRQTTLTALCLVGFLTLLCIVCFVGCATPTIIVQETFQVEVLSVNQNILKGELIAVFLSGSRGMITNDVNKVGVKLMLGDDLHLFDISLRHAELAYYSQGKTIPIIVKYEKPRNRIIGMWLETGRNFYNGYCFLDPR